MTPKPLLVLTMINAPNEFFADPSQVAAYPRLRRSDRIDILRSWKHDMILLMQAANENRSGANSRNSFKLDGINKALTEEEESEEDAYEV